MESDFNEKGVDFLCQIPGTEARRTKLIAWRDSLLDCVTELSNCISSQSGDCDMRSAGSSLIFLENLKDEYLHRIPQPSKEICRLMHQKQNRQEILSFHQDSALSLAQTLIDRSAGMKTHRQRRHCLDEAIKNLLSLERESCEQENTCFRNKLFYSLARAYYLRGKLIRPKGFSVPAKKIETLKHAMEWLAKIDPQKTLSYRLKASIYLDLARLEREQDRDWKSHDHIEILKDAIKNGCKDTENKDDILIILGHAEEDRDWLSSDTDAKHLLDAIIESNIASLLDKGRAALLLGNQKQAIDLAGQAVSDMARLRLPFSHEDWQVLVNLLELLWQEKAPDIQQTIILAWNAVCKLEQQVSLGLHVRWYWSRQRDLYDLAFYAAQDDLKLKAAIADSLKARPAMHLHMATELGIGEEAVELYQSGLLGHYITDFPTKTPKPADNNITTEWPELPKPWVAVHFYLSHGLGHPERKKTGYALIHDSQTDSWHQRTFNYQSIWAAYMTWQENYQALEEKAAPDLERLCQVMGRKMNFLFDDQLFPAERPVVFIPHDFFHRLPLHAAIQEKETANTLFAAHNPSCYLPAWWMARLTELEKSKAPADQTIGLINLNFKGVEQAINNTEGTVLRSPRSDDLLNVSCPPAKLILLCHGKANITNPFHSRLLLDDNGPTLAEILAAGNFVAGSDVILGACETDLMYPISTPLDEHITLSSSFLQKGARSIISSLWKIDKTDITDLAISCIKNATPASSQVRQWSGTTLGEYLRDPVKNLKSLYDGAAYRVHGLSSFN